jgi:probable F420-dependent oxidoreductase
VTRAAIPQWGAVFPQFEIGNDVGVIRSFFETVEGLGFQHVLAYDHVLGVGRTTRPDWDGLYDSTDAFHEPMTLFSYMAAIAPGLSPVTGVLVLPQRQTALVAKQSAAVDLFSGGRLRLGIGVGWNEAEFDGLGATTFSKRGKAIEEQIRVLRELWSCDTITTTTPTEQFDDVGINPRPKRMIPIWMGGMSPAAVRRAGRLADGWMPMQNWSDAQAERIDLFRSSAQAAGRDPRALGLDTVMSMWRTPRNRWHAEVDLWRTAGATHITANTLRTGLHGAHHLTSLEHFARDFGLR